MRLSLLACVFASFALANTPDKKLIEFGWDEPDTAFMRTHIAEMEQTPFDGCVFLVNYRDGKTTGSFLREAWGSRAFTPALLQPAIEDLKATPFKKFTENLLRVDVTPGNVDWFDDFSPILNNMKLAARIARQGGCRGILFDTEMYGAQLWTYKKQSHAKDKTFDDYRKQAHQRGREVMRAFQEEYPGLTILLTFGYTLPRAETGGDLKKLPDAGYGLLPAFLDGMTQEAAGETKLIDGYELSYAFQTASQFEKGRKDFNTRTLPFVGNAELYREHFTQGFGLWIDQDWRKLGWNVENPAKNFFTPEKLQAATRLALKDCNRYVWIYTEKPKWWTPSGRSENLPAAYADALRRAKESLAK